MCLDLRARQCGHHSISSTNILYHGAIQSLFPIALAHEDDPLALSPWLLFKAHYPLCTLESAYEFPIMHRWYCSPKHLSFPTNTHAGKKIAEDGKWRIDLPETGVSRHTMCLFYIQYYTSSGRNIKEVLIKTTNKDGRFCKISCLQNFIAWYNEILFIYSFLLNVSH